MSSERVLSDHDEDDSFNRRGIISSASNSNSKHPESEIKRRERTAGARKNWKPEEWESLRNIIFRKDEEGLDSNWPEIVSELGTGRSVSQCANKYKDSMRIERNNAARTQTNADQRSSTELNTQNTKHSNDTTTLLTKLALAKVTCGVSVAESLTDSNWNPTHTSLSSTQTDPLPQLAVNRKRIAQFTTQLDILPRKKVTTTPLNLEETLEAIDKMAEIDWEF